MAMDKLAEVIDAARTLSPDERRRLIGELDALERLEGSEPTREATPLAALLAASGSAHSDFTDVSTNKYAHVAAAAADSER
jgi:hypothetical protein